MVKGAVSRSVGLRLNSGSLNKAFCGFTLIIRNEKQNNGYLTKAA